jgi:hypothetical protein
MAAYLLSGIGFPDDPISREVYFRLFWKHEYGECSSVGLPEL